MPIPEQIDEMEIDDIRVGAFFLLAGCQIMSTRSIGRKVLIVFKNPSGGSMADLRKEYFLGATGKLKEYSDKLQTLKELVTNP
jgi:hypothetical protein